MDQWIGEFTEEAWVLDCRPYSVFWDGINNSGQRASQGLYFLRLQAGDEESSVRMLLTK
jgi:hypothetical protein